MNSTYCQCSNSAQCVQVGLRQHKALPTSDKSNWSDVHVQKTHFVGYPCICKAHCELRHKLTMIGHALQWSQSHLSLVTHFACSCPLQCP